MGGDAKECVRVCRLFACSAALATSNMVAVYARHSRLKSKERKGGASGTLFWSDTKHPSANQAGDKVGRHEQHVQPHPPASSQRFAGRMIIGRGLLFLLSLGVYLTGAPPET